MVCFSFVVLLFLFLFFHFSFFQAGLTCPSKDGDLVAVYNDQGPHQLICLHLGPSNVLTFLPSFPFCVCSTFPFLIKDRGNGTDRLFTLHSIEFLAPSYGLSQFIPIVHFISSSFDTFHTLYTSLIPISTHTNCESYFISKAGL